MGIRAHLERALVEARKTRDQLVIAVLRGALSEIDNAGAVDESGQAAGDTSGRFGEPARRELDEAEVRSIVEREISEYEATAAALREGHRHEEASDADARASALRRHLS